MHVAHLDNVCFIIPVNDEIAHGPNVHSSLTLTDAHSLSLSHLTGLLY